MAAGYLDLLQRELRDTVIHPFASVAELLAHSGIDGQVASTGGTFYIYSNGAWRRILDETDLALIEAELGRTAQVYTVVIPASAEAAGIFAVPHGFTDRPVVEVTGPSGAVYGVDVVHEDGWGRSQVVWDGVLPTPATVTVIGQPQSA